MKKKNRRFGLRAQKATTSLKTKTGGEILHVRKHLKSSLNCGSPGLLVWTEW